MTALTIERISHYAILKINRPEKLNALNAELFNALNTQLSELENDDALRVLVITGSGDRAFCAGTDISELSEADGARLSERGQQLCDRIEKFPVPVIAAINGMALGGGLELVLACHMRVASSNAVFSLPETRLGLIPGYGGSQRLTREIGVGSALDVMLTGKQLSADEALKLGLLNRVVTAEDLMTETIALVEQISKLSSSSIRACLKAVIGGLDVSLREGLQIETELFASVFETDDAREGISAFLEKREPNFN
jgi:enoyl-CoA hydratase